MKRTDTNQAEIMAALRGIGASVVDLHLVGHGCPDLAVAWHGRTWLMEVKGPEGQLRKSQRAFIASWQDKVLVVRSVNDALKAIGVTDGDEYEIRALGAVNTWSGSDNVSIC